MNFRPEIFGSTIVAVGSFNPAIFSPDWLLSLGLIGTGDRDAAVTGGADNLVVTNQVTAYKTDWFGLQVLENQFTLASKGVLTPALRDLAHGIFESVPNTPVTAVGLNFLGHFAMGSVERYHQVGDALVPKGIWHEVFPGEKSVGLADLQVFIENGSRANPGQSPDRITVQAQPSSKVKLGVFLSLNDHRAAAFNASQRAANAATAARIVRESWDATWKDAEQAFDVLLDRALSKKG